MDVISQDQNIVGGFGKSCHQVFHTAENTGLAESFATQRRAHTIAHLFIGFAEKNIDIATPVFVELIGAHLNLTNRVAPLPLPKNLT